MENEDYLEDLAVEGEESIASVSLPVFKAPKIASDYDYINNIYDYENLSELAEAINAARLALFKITEKLNEAERRGRRAKLEYERRWRRFYALSNARTEGGKRTDADTLSEDYEDKYLVYEQLAKELGRYANALRIELQTLQSVGNNTRQQMKMV